MFVASQLVPAITKRGPRTIGILIRADDHIMKNKVADDNDDDDDDDDDVDDDEDDDDDDNVTMMMMTAEVLGALPGVWRPLLRR